MMELLEFILSKTTVIFGDGVTSNMNEYILGIA